MIRPALLIAALAAFQIAEASFVTPAVAQNLFAPRVIVNDRVITEYEVQQRSEMLRLFRATGDIQAEALKGLIDDRIRLSASSGVGLKATPQQIRAGMEEFAARANLTAEQFLEALTQAGISAQTFRDFVEAGLIWRDFIRQRFSATVSITDTEIDRAIATSADNTEARVLVSEVVFPIGAGDKASVMALAQRVRDQITSESTFGAAARTFSSAATSNRGGQIDWIATSTLPDVVSSVLQRLQPGEISQPVDLGEAVGIFMLRDRRDASSVSVGGLAKYATYLLPAGSAAEAATVRSKIDSCDDLYAIAKGQSEDRLTVETLPVSQIPADIALQLAKLDKNESIDFPRGGAQVFLMLCNRDPIGADTIGRDLVRNQLANQRLAALAEIYLEQLRTEALIREP
jgi:peptidyl-prolyl cis-trans isomerase SurA